MRLFKITLITLGIFLVNIFGVSCTSAPAPATENEVVTVQRGDLRIDITAVGNLALSRTADLAFDIFYNEATVAEVLVEEGDTVKEGQLLARLDAAEWKDELSTLEDRVTTAQRQLTAAERQLITKQRGLIQAEISLKNARIALEETDTRYTIYDIRAAQANVADAQANVEEVMRKLSSYDPGTPGYAVYQKLLLQAQTSLNTAENNLEAMLSDFDTEEMAVKKLQVEQNELSLVEAQNAIEDARIAIEDARKDLRDAQNDLDEARSKSPEIRATFDGFVTMVNVAGGDEILTGTVAVQIADPNKFEAGVMVSEMDILRIKEGGEAQIQVDAVPGLTLPAKVTNISPRATIQSGVVNYSVKVEVTSAEEMMNQRQPGQGRQSGEWPRQAPAITSTGFQLREGLTVTVSILLEERNNVLLVPPQAIINKGRETLVQVLKDGISEERPVKTGISNWQFTEITDGLGEGEQIVVPQGTAAVTPSTPSGQQRGGTFIPGMGRIR